MDRKQRQQWTEQDAREALAELARTGESINELTDRVIREAINEDVSEATEQVAPKALPKTAGG
jgi:transcriptional regulator of NAD metabolism